MTTMEIEDLHTTIQEDQVPKVVMLDAPLTMEVEHGNEDNGYANRDANDGSEDLPMFGKKGLCNVYKQTSLFILSRKGVVEYLDLGEEDGMSNVQVVEVKRPRCSTHALAHKNQKRE